MIHDKLPVDSHHAKHIVDCRVGSTPFMSIRSIELVTMSVVIISSQDECHRQSNG